MDLLSLNDQDGTYPASWYAATANRTLDVPTMTGAHRADVCVIGGGYTGLHAALNLAERGYDVVLLEAQRIGWGASGRNGGQLGSGQRVGQIELQDQLGAADARQLWDLAEEAKSLVRDRIERHDIDCDLRRGQIHADIKPRYVDHTRREVELIQSYGYDKLTFLDRKAISELIGSTAYAGGAMDAGAGHLHPLNYALGLGAAAQEVGVRLFEGSRVLDVSSDKTHTIRTGDGTVTADVVIYACNGYGGTLQREVSARVMPINNFIAVTEPLGAEACRALIRNDACVADSKFVVDYYRTTADHRLLFGGGETYSYRFPKDIAALVRPNIAAIYPHLKDVRIDYAWGGTLGITLSRMPHVAQLGPTAFSAAGFSGHGVPTTALAGKVLAERVAGQAERFDLFANLKHRRFPGGPMMRHPLLVLAMTWYALRDRL